jgi:uncharacterized protein
VSDTPLLDHHCHGVLAGDVDAPHFEQLLNEGFSAAPRGTSHFQSPLGLSIRRHCAPLLDLDPSPAPSAYLARRAELGTDEVNRRFLHAAGLAGLLLDSGYRSDELLGTQAMSDLAGAPTHEIVRLESVAAEVADLGIDAVHYPQVFADTLDRRAQTAVGLKSVVAYRGGFIFDPSPPDRPEVVRAAGRWLHERESDRAPLRDSTLLRYGIWTGVELARLRGFPIQFHVGYGDPDLTLHLANPTLLTDLIRRLADLSVNVVLLHCYPYHREAGYLAAIYPNVYFDIGLTLNHTGPSAQPILAEALELAPFTKHLYSSDAFALPELYHLGATLFRNALGNILEGWIREDRCSPDDAAEITNLIAVANAQRIYPLP